MDLFQNFDLLLAFDKLKELHGGGKRMVVCNYYGTEELWFAGLKFEKKKGQVIIKDLDYGFMQNARQVVSNSYINRMVDIIQKADKEVLWQNRNKSSFFKRRIRGICRFGDNIDSVSKTKVNQIKNDIGKFPVLYIAAIYNVSEHFVRTLKDGKQEKMD